MKKIMISPSFTTQSQDLIEKELSGFYIEPLKAPFKIDPAVEALLIRSRSQVNEELLNTYPNIKAVVSATSGFDHFDKPTVLKNRQKIHFGYTPEANSTSAAELTLFHILQVLKKSNLHCLIKRSSQLLGQELAGKHVLLVGLGRIGKKVAKYLHAFSAKVSAYDPYIESEIEGIDLHTSLEEGLRQCDLVSLHCPLTQKTKSMINRKTLSHLKKEAYLINCARGDLVVEDDLIEALKKGALSGAALDVNEEEPLPKDSPLRALESVYLSPHIGAYTEQAQKKSALLACSQILEVLNHPNNKKEDLNLTPLPYDKAWY